MPKQEDINRILKGELDWDKFVQERTGGQGFTKENVAQTTALNQEWWDLSNTPSGTRYANPNQQYGEVLQPSGVAEEAKYIAAGWQPTDQPVHQPTSAEFQGQSVQTAGGGGTPNSTGTGLTPEIMAIAQGRPDISSLYDLNTGQAKDPNDPRVKGIPTLIDWWNTYGIKEYPNLGTDSPNEFVTVVDPATGLKLEMIGSAAKNYLNKGWTVEGAGTTGGAEIGTVGTASDKSEAVKSFIERGKSLGWPQDLIDLGALAIEQYPEGQAFDVQEVINTFNKIKAETIDPYFKELTDVAISDFKNAQQNIEATRQLQLEQEQLAAGKNIEQTQAGLERAGLTFSGKGVEQLGLKSAYAAPGAGVEGAIPELQPFAGLTEEGAINQANKLMTQASAQQYQQQVQALGRSAENVLGTTGAAGLGFGYAPAGVDLTGQMGAEQQQKYATTLQQLIEQQRNKQNLTTNDLLK